MGLARESRTISRVPIGTRATSAPSIQETFLGGYRVIRNAGYKLGGSIQLVKVIKNLSTILDSTTSRFSGIPSIQFLLFITHRECRCPESCLVSRVIVTGRVRVTVTA